ncbi:signal peptidase II [Pseudoroseicyclus aestuarii]|uniref:signal peptidase II n=1 Tax=Pseudoroseicyclus aestuarii TaxID=1795041 RepID=UPI003CCC4C6E
MRITLTAAFWVFLADQATKYVVVHALDLSGRMALDVIPGFIGFRMAWNQGVNFGLFSGFDMRWVLIGVALAISAGVLVWIARGAATRWVQLSAGLLVGGALGNVVDRLLYGAVADFLNVTCCGIENPYAFNVADIAIFLGAVGLILFAGDPPKPGGAAPKGGTRRAKAAPAEGKRKAPARRPAKAPAPAPAPEGKTPRDAPGEAR